MKEPDKKKLCEAARCVAYDKCEKLSDVTSWLMANLNGETRSEALRVVSAQREELSRIWHAAKSCEQEHYEATPSYQAWRKLHRRRPAEPHKATAEEHEITTKYLNEHSDEIWAWIAGDDEVREAAIAKSYLEHSMELISKTTGETIAVIPGAKHSIPLRNMVELFGDIADGPKGDPDVTINGKIYSYSDLAVLWD